MIKIISAIIAFLLMLFPNSGSLLGAQQQVLFPGEKAAAKQIVEAIKDNDIDALIDMYCDAAKSTGEVTTENLQNLINSIEGNIKNGGLYGYDSSDHGSQKSDRQLKIKIETDKGDYLIYASWVVADTEQPERVGLLQLTLFPYFINEYPVVIAQVPLKESLKNAGY